MKTNLVKSRQITLPYLNVELICHKMEQTLFVFENPDLKANFMQEFRMCFRRAILRLKRENKQSNTEACKWLSSTLDHCTSDWMKIRYPLSKQTVI